MSRSAHLSRDSDGDALGCSIFINASELAELGIDTEDASEVEYDVTDGKLSIKGGDGDE
jgi:hypothetical protein